MSTAANPDVYGYRWASSISGGVNAPTWAHAMNTALEVAQSDLDSTIFYLYLGIENSGGMSADTVYDAQHDQGSGSYVTVPTSSSGVISVLGAGTHDETVTSATVVSNGFTAGIGTATDGRYRENVSADHFRYFGITAGNYAVAISAFQFTSSFSGGETVNFRFLDEAAAVITNDVTPTANIEEGATTVSVGLSAETDSAFSVGKLKGKAVGLNAETDTVLALTRLKTLSVGLNEETDSALAPASLKTLAVGLNAETDSAFPIVLPITVVTGLATEADDALAIEASSKVAAVGLITETDSALAIDGSVKSRAAALVTETDDALATAWVKQLVAGLALETDDALQVELVSKVAAVGLSEESDDALAVDRSKTVLAGLNEETDTPLTLGVSIVVETGLNTESDSAFALASLKTRSVEIAAETDSALTVQATLAGDAAESAWRRGARGLLAKLRR